MVGRTEYDGSLRVYSPVVSEAWIALCQGLEEICYLDGVCVRIDGKPHDV